MLHPAVMHNFPGSALYHPILHQLLWWRGPANNNETCRCNLQNW